VLNLYILLLESYLDLKEIGCEDGEVDGTGPGSCLMAGIGISSVQLLGSAI
jgi:hypothetical protein